MDVVPLSEHNRKVCEVLCQAGHWQRCRRVGVLDYELQDLAVVSHAGSIHLLIVPRREPRGTRYHIFAEMTSFSRPAYATTDRDSTAACARDGRTTCSSSGSSTASAATSARLVNALQHPSARGVGLRVLTGQGARTDTTTAGGGRVVFGNFAALAELSTVVQLSPTCGHRKIPHTLVNASSTSTPVDACGQAVCGQPLEPGATENATDRRGRHVHRGGDVGATPAAPDSSVRNPGDLER